MATCDLCELGLNDNDEVMKYYGKVQKETLF
jgi:hypothetical protein